MSDKKLPSLKVGVGWIDIVVTSEPNLSLTIRGYAPTLKVRVPKTGLEYEWYVSAKSIAEPLEELRERNGGRFQGIRLRVRKDSMERTALYRVEPVS